MACPAETSRCVGDMAAATGWWVQVVSMVLQMVVEEPEMFLMLSILSFKSDRHNRQSSSILGLPMALPIAYCHHYIETPKTWIAGHLRA